MASQCETQPEFQNAPRKFAAVLSELRNIMRTKTAEGRCCVAVLHPAKGPDPFFVSVHLANGDPAPLSETAKRLWSEEAPSSG